MVSLSSRAQEKLRDVLESSGSPEASVRIGVVRGPHGCVHGWNLAIDQGAGPEDTVVEAGDVRLLVEPELVAILDGASVDYREDAMGIGFTIDVPNTPPPSQAHDGGCH